jgi:Tfp pilus assembly protein PilW
MNRRNKQRGATLMETMLATAIASIITLGAMVMWIDGSRFYMNTETDTEISRENSATLRKISERLRSALDVEISDDGKKMYYKMPARAEAIDFDTAEFELKIPVQWDGVERGYVVDGDKLKDIRTGHVLVDHIIAHDPDPTALSEPLRSISLRSDRPPSRIDTSG